MLNNTWGGVIGGGVGKGQNALLENYLTLPVDPTADELKRIMMLHGGVFLHYPSSRATHIIAKNLPDVKVRKYQNLILMNQKMIICPILIVIPFDNPLTLFDIFYLGEGIKRQ